MDSRIARIIELERTAGQREKATSAERWEAASLIWMELQSGKTQQVVADAIGRSQTHVCWASRCWGIVRGYVFDSFEQLQDFGKLYQSDEIRNPKKAEEQRQVEEEEDDDEKRLVGNRKPREDTQDDHSIHSIIRSAASVIDGLIEHRAYCQLLTPEDREVLADMAKKVQLLLARQSG